jgi:hypothetical protein
MSPFHPDVASVYIYIVFKNLRLVSLICFLSLTSNLVGNLVWTYVAQEDSVELTADEEDSDPDSDPDSKSSKRSVNLLEEELHLADGLNTHFNFTTNLFDKTGFSNDIVKPVGQDRTPLENPPENNNVLS